MMRRWRAVIGCVGLAVMSLGLTACGDTETCSLCEAIEARDPAGVQARLEAGELVTRGILEQAVDPNALGSRLRGSPPEARDRLIVELLIEQADPNDYWSVMTTSRRTSTSTGTSSRRYTYLAAAIASVWDDNLMPERMLGRGLDVGGVPGGEALYAAVAARHVGVVRLLLEAGAPVNHEHLNYPKNTPLSVAIQSRDLALIALLEAAGGIEWKE